VHFKTAFVLGTLAHSCQVALQESKSSSSGFSLSQFFCNPRWTRWWWYQISMWSPGWCQTPCAYTNLTGLLQ